MTTPAGARLSRSPRLALILALCLLAPLLAAVPAGGTPSLNGDDLAELDAALSRTVLPAPDDMCGVRVEREGQSAMTIPCELDETAGTTNTASGEDELSLEERAMVPTARGWAVPTPHQGSVPGATAVVFSHGDAMVVAPDGQPVWFRHSMSFYEDWGRESPVVPRVAMGTAPTNPMAIAGERPFAVADVTGDGVDDVVVASFFLEESESGDVSGATAVTLLDGRDGRTWWFDIYDGYITQVLSPEPGLLLVANSSGPGSTVGQDGSTSTLSGIALETAAEGSVAATEIWRYDTGQPWARWLSLEPMGAGRVAAAWTATPVDAGGVGGHVVSLDPSDGTVGWSVETAGYPRTLRYDAGRAELVVHEQTFGVVPRHSYDLVALEAADGSESRRLSRLGAVLLGLTVADAAAGPEAEWITTDLEYVPDTAGPSLVVDRVAVASADTGALLWEDRRVGHTVSDSYELPPALSVTYAVTVSDGVVAAASSLPYFEGSELRAFDGATGTILWSHRGDPAFPLFLTPVDEGFLVAGDGAVARTYQAADGVPVTQTSLLAEQHVGTAVDVNDDGTTDLVTGGRGGVFAFDGHSLHGGHDAQPDLLWSAPTMGAVHELRIDDVTGDGVAEVVVAATHGVEVFALGDGSRRYGVEIPGEYVWSVSTGDLTGDGGADIVVPTTSLTAYQGSDGAPLWEHRPEGPRTYFSNVAVTRDHRAVAQYLVDFPSPLASRHHQVVLAVDGTTGEVAWSRSRIHAYATPMLWRGVVSWQEGDTDHVAVTWEGRPEAVSIGPRPMRVDVHDSATGDIVWRSGPFRGQLIHKGTVLAPDLLHVAERAVTEVAPDDPRTTYFCGVPCPASRALSDAAVADFGPAGRWLIGTYTGVRAYPDGTQRGEYGDEPGPAATWSGLLTGRLLVHDFDGNGAEEVVALAFDWPAHVAVSQWAGIQIRQWDILPRGIAVLEGHAPGDG